MFLVLGNATIDESMATELWPAPGETIVVGAPARDLGGKGVNQALMLARTGAQVRLVAAVGRDAEGDWIAARLAAEHLAGGLLRVNAATDRSLIFVSREGENAIASTVDAARSLTPDFAHAEAAALPPGGALMLQGNLTPAATEAALVAARAAGARAVFNPSPIQPGCAAWLPQVDLLIVNESEAVALGFGGAPETAVQALRRAGAQAVALTLGGRGCVYADAADVLVTPAEAVSVVDTTGAGDAFAGTLVGGLYHRRLAPAAALAAAAAAAALTVQRPGAASAFPSVQEIDAIFAR